MEETEDSAGKEHLKDFLKKGRLLQAASQKVPLAGLQGVVTVWQWLWGGFNVCPASLPDNVVDGRVTSQI